MYRYFIPAVLSSIMCCNSMADDVARAANLALSGLKQSAMAGQQRKINCPPVQETSSILTLDYGDAGSFENPATVTKVEIKNNMIQQVLKDSGYSQNPLPIHSDATQTLPTYYGGIDSLRSGKKNIFPRTLQEIRYFHSKIVAGIYNQTLDDLFDNVLDLADVHVILGPTGTPTGLLAHTYVCKRPNQEQVVKLDTISILESEPESGCQGGTVIQIAQTYSFEYNDKIKAVFIRPQKAGLEYVINGQIKQVFGDTAEELVKTLNYTYDPLVECALTFTGFVCDQHYRPEKKKFSSGAQPECKKLDPKITSQYWELRQANK